MPSTTRTFVAVAVPELLETKLTRLQQQLGGELTGVRWSTTPPFHVTLAFLGDVDNTDLRDVCAAVSNAVVDAPPFDLGLEGVGVFPDPNRPRVLWTGLASAGIAPLKFLHENIAAATAALGYPADTKRFHPHVTLGRFPPERGGTSDPDRAHVLANLISHYKTWHAGPFRVGEAVIFSSTLTREGPAYAPLGRAHRSVGGNPKRCLDARGSER